MHQKIMVIILLQFWFHLVSSGQDSIPKKSSRLFGIYTGYSHHLIRDDVASPLIYKGTQAPVEFTYRKIGSKFQQSITFNIDNLELHSSITDKSGFYVHYADNLNILLDYTCNRKAFAINPIKTDCFLGVKILSVLNARNFHYYNGNSIFFAEQLNSLGINFLFEKKFDPSERNHFRFNINIPLITYVILNDRYNAVVSETFNNIDFNKNVLWQVFTDGEIVSLDKLVEYQTELSYSRFLTRHVGFELKHRLHFYYFTQFEDLLHARSLTNQFLIGLIVKF